MSLYQKLARKPKPFLTLTGMELREFERLLPELQAAYDQQEQTRKVLTVRDRQERQRQPGAGAHYGNDLPDRCLMLLLYYQLYVTQDFLSLLFKASDKSVICRGIQSVRAAWQAVLPVPAHVRERILSAAREVTKQRRKRIGSLEEFREAYPELEFLIDGTEQPKRKPQNKQKRKDECSGKKKRHTHKQLVTATRSGLIVDQSPARRTTSKSSKRITPDVASSKSAPAYASRFTPTAAFKAYKTKACRSNAASSSASTRNHPLTRAEREINRYRASQRMANEHVIGRRKKYQIAAPTNEASGDAIPSAASWRCCGSSCLGFCCLPYISVSEDERASPHYELLSLRHCFPFVL